MQTGGYYHRRNAHRQGTSICAKTNDNQGVLDQDHAEIVSSIGRDDILPRVDEYCREAKQKAPSIPKFQCRTLVTIVAWFGILI